MDPNSLSNYSDLCNDVQIVSVITITYIMVS